MKKIFVMIICAIALTSCGTMSKIENSPYVAEAYGFSFDKDAAYRKAYDKAMAKISEKFNLTVKTNGFEVYEGYEASKDNKESVKTSYTAKTESKVNASNIVVSKVKYKRDIKRGWECYIVVRVSENNLQ